LAIARLILLGSGQSPEPNGFLAQQFLQSKSQPKGSIASETSLF